MPLSWVPGRIAEYFLWARRYLLQNMDWLEEEVGEYEDDYLIIDCPGTSLVLVFESNFFFLPCRSTPGPICGAD